MKLTGIDGIKPEPDSDVMRSKHAIMRWGVVTSAVGEMTRIRIDAARLLIPHVLVAVAGVTRGKPRPEEYRIAADCLGVAVDEFVVFEDSATSMETRCAAGCRTIGIAATRHLPFPDADQWIEDSNGFEIELASSG